CISRLDGAPRAIRTPDLQIRSSDRPFGPICRSHPGDSRSIMLVDPIPNTLSPFVFTHNDGTSVRGGLGRLARWPEAMTSVARTIVSSTVLPVRQDDLDRWSAPQIGRAHV